MGCVICYGALITMFFILTIMPIAYWKVMGEKTHPQTPPCEGGE
jgi:hypothetical protein